MADIGPVEILLALPLAALLLLGLRRLVVAALTPKSRPCPQCGRRVEVGVLDCQGCGYNFRIPSGS
jgi:uncharacterized membrane protein YqjE